MKTWLKKLRLAPEEIQETLRYYKRRPRHLDVDSFAEHAQTMMFLTDRPGRYIGLGYHVISVPR